MEKRPLNVDLRNASKSDLLNLSNNFRTLAWLHENSYYTNILFILSIFVAVLIGILSDLMPNFISTKSSLLLTVSLLIILFLIMCYIILGLYKSKMASNKLFNLSDWMLQTYFPNK